MVFVSFQQVAATVTTRVLHLRLQSKSVPEQQCQIVLARLPPLGRAVAGRRWIWGKPLSPLLFLFLFLVYSLIPTIAVKYAMQCTRIPNQYGLEV